MTSPRSQWRGTATWAIAGSSRGSRPGNTSVRAEQAGGLLPVGHVRIMTAWQSHVKP